MLTKVMNRAGWYLALLVLTLAYGPLHSQSVEIRAPWEVALRSGYVATGGLSDVAPGLFATAFAGHRISTRVDLRLGVAVSGHGYTAIDVPGGDRQFAFPLVGDPTYEFFTAYAGPVVWLGGVASHWSPYVGGMLSGVVRHDGSQGGMGVGAVGGVRYWWSRRVGVELGLNATLSRMRWSGIATFPRYEWGRWLSFGVGATIGLGR